MAKKKSNPLTQEDIDTYIAARTKFNQQAKCIDDQVERVLNAIYKYFKCKISYWGYWDGNEFIKSAILFAASRKRIKVYVETNKHPKLGLDTIFPLRYCSGRTSFNTFPKKYLFMTDEEIVADIANWFGKAKAKYDAKVAKDNKKNTTKNKLREKALAKLSAKEKEALGVK